MNDFTAPTANADRRPPATSANRREAAANADRRPLAAAGSQFNSAVYEGVVRHRRHSPHAHAFRYKMAQLYLDLDELDRVFKDRWLYSNNRRNLAEFRRSDYFGDATQPLAEAVRDAVETQTGHRSRGPIRLLTHLRYAGYSFNPVSFYYCYGADGVSLECILAEITNTPWRERHAYILPAPGLMRQPPPTPAHGHPPAHACATAPMRATHSPSRPLTWRFAKQFHVSPFMALNRQYEWTFSVPGDHLRVHMNVINDTGAEFDATLVLKRRPLDAAALRRVLWRYPLMTARVIGAIHWQALRLWLKGNPVHDHPLSARART